MAGIRIGVRLENGLFYQEKSEGEFERVHLDAFQETSFCDICNN